MERRKYDRKFKLEILRLIQEGKRLYLVAIKRAFEESQKTSKSTRITAFLKKRGYRCSENQVARLMKKHGYMAREKRLYWVTTDSAQASRKLPIFLRDNSRLRNRIVAFVPILPISLPEKGDFTFRWSWTFIPGKWLGGMSTRN